MNTDMSVSFVSQETCSMKDLLSLTGTTPISATVEDAAATQV